MILSYHLMALTNEVSSRHYVHYVALTKLSLKLIKALHKSSLLKFMQWLLVCGI